jgi:hypothetical protein
VAATKPVSSPEHHRRSTQTALAHLPAFHDPVIFAMAIAAVTTVASMAASRHRPSYQARRNELARQRGFRSYAQERKAGGAVGAGQGAASSRQKHDALPAGARDSRRRSLAALADWRRTNRERASWGLEPLTVGEAARASHVTQGELRTWAGPALRRTDHGLQPTSADRMLRTWPAIERGGIVYPALEIRGSGQGSVLSHYWHTVGQLTDAETTAQYHAALRRLQDFEGVRVGGIVLEHDADVILALASTGALDDLTFGSDSGVVAPKAAA